MKTVEILPDLFFIVRGFLNGNHFAYRGSEPVLIDTAYVRDFEETRKALTGVGVDVRSVRLIVNTHCHCDHIGGNRIIQQLSGCEIAMHSEGKRLIDARDGHGTWWSYFAQEADFFDCTRALEDGDELRIGAYTFEAVHTPGHSPDGLVLYHRKEKLLISSDALWNYDMAVITTRVEGEDAPERMRKSLEKLRTLETRVVCPGHGDMFTDFEAALTRAETRVERFIQDPVAAAWDLVKKIIVYTLLMKRGYREPGFFQHLMTAPWFGDTIDAFFHGEYDRVYRDAIRDLLTKGVVERSEGRLITSVAP